MITSILLAAMIVCVILPSTTVIHELGHALPTLLLTDRRTRLRVGRNGYLVGEWTIGRVDIEWRLFSFGGSAWPDGPVARRSALAIVAGGPIASLLTLMAYSTLSAFVDRDNYAVTEPLRWGIIFSLVTLVLSAFPIRYPTAPTSNPNMPILASDGYWIFHILHYPAQQLILLPGSEPSNIGFDKT